MMQLMLSRYTLFNEPGLPVNSPGLFNSAPDINPFLRSYAQPKGRRYNTSRPDGHFDEIVGQQDPLILILSSDGLYKGATGMKSRGKLGL
jgi:hypothetical protein